ncbi:MAG: M20/M25/M40 family metallo-hydrolase [Acidimicrobiia bacterium]
MVKKSTTLGIALAGATAAAAAAALKWSSSLNDVPDTEAPRALPAREADVSDNDFLDHLGAAVRINTTSHDDRSKIDTDSFLAFHAFLEDTYPLIHEHCTREIVADYSLLYTWEGTEPKADPIVLMAHIDVVPVEAGTEHDWTEPPFSGTEAQDHLWGRGTLDDKGPLIATMEGVEHLLRTGFQPSRTVFITFGHDEEIGGREGAAAVASLLHSREVTPWLVFDEGGFVVDEVPMLSKEPVALIKVSEKGYANVHLTARASGGHSSFPPKTTAAGMIGEAVHLLERNPMPPRVSALADMFDALSPRMDPKVRSILTNLKVTAPVVAKMLGTKPFGDALMRTTTAVTVVSGGHKANVLPQQASAVVNFRIIPGDTVADVVAHVEEVVGPDIEVQVNADFESREPSRTSSIESDAWHVVRESVEETFPDAIAAPWILIGGTDSRYYDDFAGDIYGFVPFSVAIDDSGFHDTNERIRTSDAEKAVSFFCRLIRNAAT